MRLIIIGRKDSFIKMLVNFGLLTHSKLKSLLFIVDYDLNSSISDLFVIMSFDSSRLEVVKTLIILLLVFVSCYSLQI